MIDVERINSQLSLLCEKVITSVYLGGGLMINMERINSQLSLSCEKVITSVDLGGLTIDMEKVRGGINSQCVNSQCREGQ